MQLNEYIRSVINVSQRLQDELNRIAVPVDIAKGELLLKFNERSKYLYFITKGLLRGYYFQEEKEITGWFAAEGEFATCFYAFINQATSTEYIQVIENSSLLKISYEDLQKLYMEFPETERIGRLLTEQYYNKLEGRLLGIQFRTAKERYENLLNSNPALLQRASLGQIASWLGITQETLSRIRSDS